MQLDCKHFVTRTSEDVQVNYCTHFIREGFKNPRHGNFPLGGYPAPGASTDEIYPKS